MDHRIDLENNRNHRDFIKGKNSMKKHGTNLEEFGMEEEFNIPKKKDHPSIRERHDQFYDYD
ncbi:MAG: hypothetical protein GX072_10735 [Lysinibacillus sp.]|nr:hypothetical protein [Lysinibacillus sp.]